MREISVSKIKEAVSELCLSANFELRKDILKALKAGLKKETNSRAKKILQSIVENAKIARAKRIAICQDTGVAFVHLDIGQEVLLVGGDLRKAVDDGVEEAYRKGCLRKSVVDDPVIRNNTKTNTPSFLVT
ncbi:MAG: fumarate hydratase, partial [Candidatus Omnitrophica bacterium]|nr:fumarate hydratase [Candidatus Omnitrophota bacterium]